MIKVRATFPGYFDHRRIKPGAVFMIQNMGAFSKNWMEKVDGDAVDEINKTDDLRGPSAMSEGGSKALHQGKVDKPGKTMKNKSKQKDVEAPKENETTGDEDVI